MGLLIGIGRRAGTALRPLNATAYTVLGTRADGVWGFDAVVTIMGVLVVLAVSAMAGIIVARLSPSYRTLRVLVAAAGVALVGYLLHVHVAARVDGGLSALLSIGELRALYVTLASASGAGHAPCLFTRRERTPRLEQSALAALRSRFGTRARHARDDAARNFGRVRRVSIWEARRAVAASNLSPERARRV